jgi:hypothetical protein
VILFNFLFQNKEKKAPKHQSTTYTGALRLQKAPKHRWVVHGGARCFFFYSVQIAPVHAVLWCFFFFYFESTKAPVGGARRCTVLFFNFCLKSTKAPKHRVHWGYLKKKRKALSTDMHHPLVLWCFSC